YRIRGRPESARSPSIALCRCLTRLPSPCNRRSIPTGLARCLPDTEVFPCRVYDIVRSKECEELRLPPIGHEPCPSACTSVDVLDRCVGSISGSAEKETPLGDRRSEDECRRREPRIGIGDDVFE